MDMNYRVIDKEKYYRSGVFRHFTEDCKCSSCEMKYSINEYSYTGKDDESLRNKIVSLKTLSKTRHSIHPVLVTTYGLKDGVYSGRIQAVVTANDLFCKLR